MKNEIFLYNSNIVVIIISHLLMKEVHYVYVIYLNPHNIIVYLNIYMYYQLLH